MDLHHKEENRLNGNATNYLQLFYFFRGGGDFGANTIVKGIREAANDPAVDAVVLRIDSGGGDVVASDTIGDAIRWCQDEKKKPVIVSFGNTSASGGYFVSTHAKAIMAQRKFCCSNFNS